MFCSVLSAGVFGVGAYLVNVEADMGNGLPGLYMVGLLSSEIKEARERVRAAIKNSAIVIPPRKIVVNLSPADKKKEGAVYDLPIAIAILSTYEIIKKESIEKTVFAGELSLDGSIRKIKGVVSMAILTKKTKNKRIVVPLENYHEAKQIEGIEVIGVSRLDELVEILNGKKTPNQKNKKETTKEMKNYHKKEGFALIKGQKAVKRAVMIAVAGRHNLLLIGNPGSGKSLIAKAIPSILPELSAEEEITLSEIYSILGELPADGLMKNRPFRNIHHTITPTALVGGGRLPKPGEITMAHLGVLFMDELAEFKRETINVLRQPLEDKKICISRKEGRVEFQADFMFVGAMNLCPCGYYPNLNRCNCSKEEIRKYFSRVKGPVLDRIDICIEVSKARVEEIQKIKEENSEEETKRLISKVDRIQKERYADEEISYNSSLNLENIEKFCFIGDEEKILLSKLYENMDLTPRGYHKIIKVARTIADLRGGENINCEDILEAAAYRDVF